MSKNHPFFHKVFSMQPFLKTVATEYYNRYDNLSVFTFIFPNKRSGAFFLKYLRDCSLQPSLAPKVKTISEFVEDVVETPVDNNIDLIFKLFMAYRKLIGDKADFEKFRSFGETVLSDFNEVDMHMVDPESLFKNVRDLNHIKSNFVTQRQLDVMREYFNYPDDDHIRVEHERFWRNFEDFDYSEEKGIINPKDGKKLEEKFIHLWSLLYPLYVEFKKLLREEQVNTAGGSFRDCALKLVEMDSSDPLLKNKKYVFVGFNALTESERQIFAELKKRSLIIEGGEEPAADFIWDISNRFFTDKENPASKYVLINSRKDAFPFPEWWVEKDPEGDVENPSQRLRVISVPSNSMQIKIIRNEIESLIDVIGKEKVEQAAVAVVLPEDSFLLPLLNSMPKGDFNINLTMGYSMKYTAAMSFISYLRKLQTKKKIDKKAGAYFIFDDVKRFLHHPFSRLIFGAGEIRKFILDTRKSRTLVVSFEYLCRWNPLCKEFFTILDSQTTPARAISYLKNALNIAADKLENSNSKNLNSSLDIFFIRKALDAVVQLENCIAEYDIQMNFSSLFSILDKLLAGVSATFEGEPLGGLQIMGLLETRNLDFDYIFIPGMNDKVMPRAGFSRTFIPNALRKAFGMPPSNFQETLFAYYFYRLLGKSREVVLTYDSRATDNKRGSLSRYVLQLKHIFPESRLEEYEADFILKASEERKFEIPKDEEIVEILNQFKTPEFKSRMRFSASSLGKYCSCPVQFYYSYILKLKVEQEPMEAIDAPTQGSIIHEAMEHLYLPDNGSLEDKFLDSPVKIDRKYIQNILDDDARIELELKKAINHYHYGIKDEAMRGTSPIGGSALLVFPNLKKQLKDILNYDLTQTPFLLYGCEIGSTVELEIEDGVKVNFKLVIDRLDYLEEQDVLRIVDYKTGAVHIKASDFEDVFNGNYSAKQILQLFTYAYLLKVLRKQKEENKGDKKNKNKAVLTLPLDKLRTEIYDVPKMSGTKYKINLPKIGEVTYDNFDGKIAGWFADALKNKIKEILDPSVPFRQTDDEKNCEWCDFKLLCETRKYNL